MPALRTCARVRRVGSAHVALAVILHAAWIINYAAAIEDNNNDDGAQRLSSLLDDRPPTYTPPLPFRFPHAHHHHVCIHDHEDMKGVLHHHGHDRIVPQHRRRQPTLDVTRNEGLPDSSSTSTQRSRPNVSTLLPQSNRSGSLNVRSHHVLSAAGLEHPTFRIVVSALDTSITGKFCSASMSTNASAAAPDFTGGTIACSSDHQILTTAKRELLLGTIIPRAIRMHQQRLYVAAPVVGNITISQSTTCPYFTTPAEHLNVGVQDADFVLYVAAGLTKGLTIAWAGYCQLDDLGRPVTGRMNFNPAYIPAIASGNTSDVTNAEAAAIDSAVRTAAHELTHALGFSSSLILSDQELTGTAEGVRGKEAAVRVVTAPVVVSVARAHFNCSTLQHVELEDDGGTGTLGSHWEARNHLGELMVGVAGKGLYTSLTVAMMEASGLYVAIRPPASSNNSTDDSGLDSSSNSSSTDDLSTDDVANVFGKNAGCRFVSAPCIVNGSLTTTQPAAVFCNNTRLVSSSLSTVSQGDLQCTWDRMSLGACSVAWSTNTTPMYAHFYFPTPPNASSSSDPNSTRFVVGTYPLVDSCPMVSPVSSSCLELDAGRVDAAFYDGSYYGQSSRCLDTIGLARKQYSFETGAGSCLRVRCVGGTRLQFAVGALVDPNFPWVDCPHDGQPGVVSLDSTSSAYKGSVKCPLAQELCWDTTLLVSESAASPPTTTTTIIATTTTTTVMPTTTVPVPSSSSLSAATISTTSIATTPLQPTATLVPKSTASSTTKAPTPTENADRNTTAQFVLSSATPSSETYDTATLLEDICAVLGVPSSPSSWNVTTTTTTTALGNASSVIISFGTSSERDAVLAAVVASHASTSEVGATTRFSGVINATAVLPNTASSPPPTHAPPQGQSFCDFCPSTVTISIICVGAVILCLMAAAICWYRKKTHAAMAAYHASYGEEALEKLRAKAVARRAPPPPRPPLLLAPVAPIQPPRQPTFVHVSLAQPHSSHQHPTPHPSSSRAAAPPLPEFDFDLL